MGVPAEGGVVEQAGSSVSKVAGSHRQQAGAGKSFGSRAKPNRRGGDGVSGESERARGGGEAGRQERRNRRRAGSMSDARWKGRDHVVVDREALDILIDDARLKSECASDPGDPADFYARDSSSTAESSEFTMVEVDEAATVTHQAGAESTTASVWMGDLCYWMDEQWVYSLFAHTGSVVGVKVVRNYETSISEGYAFIDFKDRESAQYVLDTYSGTPIPGMAGLTGVAQLFRLNWASRRRKLYNNGRIGCSSVDNHVDKAVEYPMFVGDLSTGVSDYSLQEAFKGLYKSVKCAKVVTDPFTTRSKGYGFVRFLDEEERDRAIVEMNGTRIGRWKVRLSTAVPKAKQSRTVVERQTETLRRHQAAQVEAQILNHYQMGAWQTPVMWSSSAFPPVPMPMLYSNNGALQDQGLWVPTMAADARNVHAGPCMDPDQMKEIGSAETLAGTSSAPVAAFPQAQWAHNNRGAGSANTTLFVCGIPVSANQMDLLEMFGAFGQVVYIRVPPGKSRQFAFVQYVEHDAALKALESLQGEVIKGSKLRIQWSRNPSYGTSY